MSNEGVCTLFAGLYYYIYIIYILYYIIRIYLADLSCNIMSMMYTNTYEICLHSVKVSLTGQP